MQRLPTGANEGAKYVTTIARRSLRIIFPAYRGQPRMSLGVICLEARSEVLKVLDEVLGLKGRSRDFSDATQLLGSVPELDSMAVVSVITGLEERFGFTVDDDELSGATFATVGALVAFVDSKLSG